MQQPHTIVTTLRCCCAAATIMSCQSQAYAAGYAVYEQGATEQGTSYAGATAGSNAPSTLAYNPAGIVRLPGYQISISDSLIVARSRLEDASANRAASFGNSPITGTSGVNAASTSLIPNIMVSAELTPAVYLGLAITTPFGSTVKYDAISIARYWAETSALKTIDVAPTIAYRFSPQLSASATLHVETESARLSNGIDFGAIGAAVGLARAGLLPGRADGSGRFDGNDTSVGWQVGALYQPTTTLRIGVEYRAAIVHRLTGSVAYAGVPPALAPAFTAGAASAKILSPARASIGVAQDFGYWTVLADVQWMRWSSVPDLTITPANPASEPSTIRQNFRDGWLAAIGAEYHLMPNLTVRAGTALDTTPTTDATRTPSVPDGNRVLLSAGATWQATSALDLTVAYSHVFFTNSKIMLDDAGPGTINGFRGSLTGVVHNAIDIASLQATAHF